MDIESADQKDIAIPRTARAPKSKKILVNPRKNPRTRKSGASQSAGRRPAAWQAVQSAIKLLPRAWCLRGTHPIKSQAVPNGQTLTGNSLMAAAYIMHGLLFFSFPKFGLTPAAKGSPLSRHPAATEPLSPNASDASLRSFCPASRPRTVFAEPQ